VKFKKIKFEKDAGDSPFCFDDVVVVVEVP
jgi:hypothetical protein